MDELGAGSHQAVASAQDRQIGLGPGTAVMDGGEQLRVEPGQPGQVFGIGSIVLARVLVDQAQLPGVRDKDLMPEMGQERADPTGVGPDLHGHPAGRKGSEPALQRTGGGGNAALFDHLAVRIEEAEIGLLVAQIDAGKNGGIFGHGRVLLS